MKTKPTFAVMDCFAIVMAESSVRDAVTNNVSAFNLVQVIRIAGFIPGGELPYEVSYFLAGGKGHKFEVRSVWLHQNGTPEPSDRTHTVEITDETTRITHKPIPYPHAPGVYDLAFEWRPAGSGTAEWKRGTGRWRVEIVSVPVAASTAGKPAVAPN